MGGLTGMFLLNRLRRAIAKVRFLLSSSATRWILISSASGSRRLSFRDRQGLLESLSSSDRNSSNISEYFDAVASPWTPSVDSFSPSPGQQQQLPRTISSTWARIVNRTPSGLSPAGSIVRSGTSTEDEAAAAASVPVGGLPRAESSFSNSGDEDVDQKADEFINRFRERLQMERMVSLELRYAQEGQLQQQQLPGGAADFSGLKMNRGNGLELHRPMDVLELPPRSRLM